MLSDCCLQTINSEGIDCGWKRVDGYLFPASGDQKDFDNLDKEMSAYIRAGLTDVKKVLRRSCICHCICIAKPLPQCAALPRLHLCQGMKMKHC